MTSFADGDSIDAGGDVNGWSGLRRVEVLSEVGLDSFSGAWGASVIYDMVSSSIFSSFP